MANFKPQITVITEESNRDYHWRQLKSPYAVVRYDTYKELRKNIKTHLLENLEAQVSVCRSKRGQWGEWFENWKLVNGEPTIVKEGWC